MLHPSFSIAELSDGIYFNKIMTAFPNRTFGGKLMKY
ncbi:hypothetical protein EMGBS15_05720 [Filimonas sp.]|nr:hypothetical protein EMGBS15_05720 [Filimonas sp.]